MLAARAAGEMGGNLRAAILAGDFGKRRLRGHPHRAGDHAADALRHPGRALHPLREKFARLRLGGEAPVVGHLHHFAQHPLAVGPGGGIGADLLDQNVGDGGRDLGGDRHDMIDGHPRQRGDPCQLAAGFVVEARLFEAVPLVATPSLQVAPGWLAELGEGAAFVLEGAVPPPVKLLTEWPGRR